MLSNVFTRYREINIAQEGLDPVFYISLAQLAYDSMLKLTKVELDLIPPDQCHIHTPFKNNVRGGLTMCPHRYAKANNKYMSDYDSTEPSSFIMYMDICGMYSSVQLEELPFKDLTDMTEDEMENWEDYLNIEGEGCFLVVDLDYPLELHDKHNLFPLCPDHLDGILDAHLWPRYNFGMYYKSLKTALDYGMVLTKIDQGVKFKEEAFVKPFIELNTKL